MSDDPRKVNRVAAAMAVSNYGHLGLSIPVERVHEKWLPRGDPRYSTPGSEVCDLAGSIMETDDHEEMFAGEAESWAKSIRQAGGLLKFAEQYPHHAEWIIKIHNMEAAS